MLWCHKAADLQSDNWGREITFPISDDTPDTWKYEWHCHSAIVWSEEALLGRLRMGYMLITCPKIATAFPLKSGNLDRNSTGSYMSKVWSRQASAASFKTGAIDDSEECQDHEQEKTYLGRNRVHSRNRNSPSWISIWTNESALNNEGGRNRGWGLWDI